VGFCEWGNEVSNSINAIEFIEHLSKYSFPIFWHRTLNIISQIMLCIMMSFIMEHTCLKRVHVLSCDAPCHGCFGSFVSYSISWTIRHTSILEDRSRTKSIAFTLYNFYNL
jgi:hypothetical protein